MALVITQIENRTINVEVQQKGFYRIKGCRDLPVLAQSLETKVYEISLKEYKDKLPPAFKALAVATLRAAPSAPQQQSLTQER